MGSDPKMLTDPVVTIARSASATGYGDPTDAFSPSEDYAEYAGPRSRRPNPVYGLVRRLLAESGLDAPNFGTPLWNPLGDLIRPGNTVVVKPNWVLDWNHSGQGMDCMITHAAILRPILDFVLAAKAGRVVVGDAPVQGCNWENLFAVGRFRELVDHFHTIGAPLEWLDFRRSILKGTVWMPTPRQDLRPLERYCRFDLGEQSLLEPISGAADRFRVTMYDPDVMGRAHGPGRHTYLIAREVLEADVVVNVPKLKTHKKAAVTGALKNLVGINGDKDYLPHHRKGGSSDKGDCYSGSSWMKRRSEDLLDAANRRAGPTQAMLRQTARVALGLARLAGEDTNIEGNWHGNDTVWRMSLDLNRILLYGRPDGTMEDTPQRVVLNITDAVVAGQGEGPLAPEPKHAGAVTLARNAAAAEVVHCHLMGLDYRRIPLICEAFGHFRYPLAQFSPDEVAVRFAGSMVPQPWLLTWVDRFRPPAGWYGHCEMA